YWSIYTVKIPYIATGKRIFYFFTDQRTVSPAKKGTSESYWSIYTVKIPYIATGKRIFYFFTDQRTVSPAK
ncbi:hypothetical protein, partial [Salmonella enterica]|uniref:hypothetical protein n=1 Tax=Salmonella enterica TaxID=28901 RepID=UPI002EAF729A|nr:hypothetical protein [Salmonella enterica subsp. enterica serovar Paratyphi A]